MSLLLLRVCHPNQHHHQLRRALPTSAWNKITNINPYITNISRRQRTISSSRITIERVTDDSHFLQRPDQKDLVFGTVLTDHMLEVEWKKDQKSWSAPRIVPYHDLQISPAASCLHYGLQCFEGMKAYRSLAPGDDSIRLFRPDKNMKRLSDSMDRLDMPGYDFDRVELMKCIAELVRTDQRWIPKGLGYSLYIRPTVIATQRFLGLAAPESVLLYVICSPVGPYYKESGFEPVKLTADTPYVRAWPGGTGCHKVGGNYASTMKAQSKAASAGYGQVLWLFNDEVTEVGAMNVFFVLARTDGGGVELVTAPLDRGDILPGVTRDSVLHLARTKWQQANTSASHQQQQQFIVSERYLTMTEIQEAAATGRLLEAFGAGTAAVVTPIRSIQYKGADIEIPATGPITKRVWDEITGIQYGTMEGPPGWSVKL